MSYSARFAPLPKLGLVAFLLGGVLLPRPAAADATCTGKGCHGDPALKQKFPKRQLVVDLPAFKRSVHGEEAGCTDCHRGLSDLEAGQMHEKKLGPPACKDCHEEAFEQYATSVHGVARKAGGKGQDDVAFCHDCHGAHDIVRVKDPKSRVSKFRLPFTCAKCHDNERVTREHHIKRPHAAEHYRESIHGRGLLEDGLIVAPSCTDCHGAHAIHPDSDPRSPIHHKNVPETCGKCHVGINEIYVKSIHGKLLAEGHPEGPVCIDCHTAHDIIKPTAGIFKLEADERCGKCHADRLERYRETYHGKAIALGQAEVAACYDCHGHHDILPHEDPKSRLAHGKRLAVCQRCHPAATEGFTGYMTHADHTDKKNYPALYNAYVLMTALLLGVFAFFGLHTLLWLVRSVALYIRDPKAFRRQKRIARQVTEGNVYVRFRPVDRFCHFLIIISFLLLVLTGMPLKFYYTGWAQWMFGWMGGAETAAWLHRLGAVITFLYFAIHLASLGGALWRNRRLYRDAGGRFRLRRFFGFVFGPDSMMPRWQDVKDFWAHNKWFFGRGPKPQFDRWTYWEKFDYLAVFWGVAVIGLSGLVMWFPEAVTRLLPGWLINVAHIVHSDEALLAAGFIFTFHFFNVHFRVEKFPMDAVIFSGRITEEELLHERGKLYQRLKESKRLEEEKISDEWPRWKRIFTPIGMIAFLTGFALMVAIYWAMASRLLE